MAVLFDPLLSYVAFSINNSSDEYITKAVYDFFTAAEILTARNTLWDGVKAECMPKLKKRHEVYAKKGSLLTIEDIIATVRALDAAEEMPCIAVSAERIHRLPMSAPSETSSISICNRLAQLEAKMTAAEDLIAINSTRIGEVVSARPGNLYADVCNGPPYRQQPQQQQQQQRRERPSQQPDHRQQSGPRQTNAVPSQHASETQRSSAALHGVPEEEFIPVMNGRRRRKKAITGTRDVPGSSANHRLTGAP